MNAICPSCGNDCRALPHDSAYCGTCFLSFRPSQNHAPGDVVTIPDLPEVGRCVVNHVYMLDGDNEPTATVTLQHGFWNEHRSTYVTTFVVSVGNLSPAGAA